MAFGIGRVPRGTVRLMVCEGPCNPDRLALEAAVEPYELRKRRSGDHFRVLPAQNGSILRALRHTKHVYGAGKWAWVCAECGTGRV